MPRSTRCASTSKAPGEFRVRSRFHRGKPICESAPAYALTDHSPTASSRPRCGSRASALGRPAALHDTRVCRALSPGRPTGSRTSRTVGPTRDSRLTLSPMLGSRPEFRHVLLFFEGPSRRAAQFFLPRDSDRRKILSYGCAL